MQLNSISGAQRWSSFQARCDSNSARGHSGYRKGGDDQGMPRASKRVW
jgi:hypothetical protein